VQNQWVLKTDVEVGMFAKVKTNGKEIIKNLLVFFICLNELF